jgi:hypothetical protein
VGRSWRDAYRRHENNARHRGIPFLLTFAEWRSIWESSGRWEQRGAGKGQYVMARPGDRGSYEIGNVVIQLAEENRADRNRNYPLMGDKNAAFGKDFWASSTEAERERRAASISGKLRGQPKPDGMGDKLSKTATGRRVVYRDGKSTWTWAYPGDADYPSNRPAGV